jgi:hypothetical protein
MPSLNETIRDTDHANIATIAAEDCALRRGSLWRLTSSTADSRASFQISESLKLYKPVQVGFGWIEYWRQL